ncbi:hypothetical protein A2U01_0117338, partial [Trifolium medium]|nr:hypothetical protein [Trifolium medium]
DWGARWASSSSLDEQ